MGKILWKSFLIGAFVSIGAKAGLSAWDKWLKKYFDKLGVSES